MDLLDCTEAAILKILNLLKKKILPAKKYIVLLFHSFSGLTEIFSNKRFYICLLRFCQRINLLVWTIATILKIQFFVKKKNNKDFSPLMYSDITHFRT